MVTWIDTTADADLISRVWADAPGEPTLTVLLDAAEVQCSTFAGVTELPVDLQEQGRYKMALLLQARSLQRSSVTGSGDQIGGDFPVTVFPMDWTVKSLLRPIPGCPGVF